MCTQSLCAEIVSLCACRPFLIQRLCDRVFKTLEESGRPIVLKTDVDEGIKKTIAWVRANRWYLEGPA